MKKSYLILAAIAAFMAFSCSREVVVDEPAALQPVLMKCVFPEAPASVDGDTKVAINLSTGKTTWEVGDQIFVHGEQASKGKTITLDAADISADGKTATIDVSGVPTYPRTDKNYESDLYACYPASLVPSGSLYYNNVFTSTNALLLGACNDGNTFHFYNICGVITFIVDDPDIDSYTFSANAGETVGYSPLMCRFAKKTDGTFVEEYVRTGSSDGGYTTAPLTSLSGPCVADGSTVNYIYLAGGTDFSDGFTFLFRKGGTPIYTVSTKEGYNVNVAHGKLLNLGDISSHLKPYVAPTSHDATHPALAGAIDLGGTSAGTANCYIVDGSESSKTFKFKAVQGNSTTSVGKVAAVSVLWETYNDEHSVAAKSVIYDVDYDFQDGGDTWITFEMPADFHAGNAVIAAKDNADNILWSWHIWVPATTITSADYGIHTAGKKMHDRNLGALKVTTEEDAGFIDVTSIGLVYQWGRKDPFLGPDKIKTDNYRNWANYTGTVSFTADARVLSLEESIQNPTLLATGTSTNKNWLSPYDEELWGDSGDKTIYDPCPPGYRVPKRDSDAILWSDDDLTTAPNWGYNNTYYWIKLGNPATVFPCSGYRNGSDFKTTFRTIIWNTHTSSYQGDYDEPYYSAYNRRVEWSSGALKIRNDSQYNSLGCAVRCVQE